MDLIQKIKEQGNQASVLLPDVIDVAGGFTLVLDKLDSTTKRNMLNPPSGSWSATIPYYFRDVQQVDISSIFNNLTSVQVKELEVNGTHIFSLYKIGRTMSNGDEYRVFRTYIYGRNNINTSWSLKFLDITIIFEERNNNYTLQISTDVISS